MGNYCNGSIYCTGPSEVLQQLYVLTQRLDDCVAISRIDGDSDLLSHIFKQDYMGEGIFYEGGGFEGVTLELYIRASRTNGHDYFQAMASGLGITIKWQYVDDYDDNQHTKMCKPKKGAPIWEMWTEEELDAFMQGSEKPPSTFRESSAGNWSFGASPGAGSYTFGAQNVLIRMSLTGSQVARAVDEHEQEGRVDQLRESIYFHCFMAHTLATRMCGTPSLLQKTRITADIYMAAVEASELAGLVLKTSLLDVSTTASRIRVVFEVDAEDMKFNFVPKSFVEYAVIKHISDTLIQFAPKLMPDYAVAMAGLPLPYGLW